MDWLYHILYGFISGLTDILPVSAPAHQRLFDVMIPDGTISAFARLMVHIAIFCALYYTCNNQLIRIARAVKLARIPKRRRKRPLDTKSLMELQMLKTMAIPLILGFIFYSKAITFVSTFLIMSVILLVNGLILYIPQFLPGSNKDARSMSPIDSFLMGIGGGLAVLPGMSAIGVTTSIGSIRGGEKSFNFQIAMTMNMGVILGMILMDFVGIFSIGMDVDGFMGFLQSCTAAAAAFGGSMLGIRIMKRLAQKTGFGIFAYYCWGAALFSFILYLTT